MAEFNVRSDSVNVEQIMEEIRARVREKRGVDYTEQQISELATVKLEKFLDARGVRSDLLEQYRRMQAAQPLTAPPSFAFEADTLYTSHRAPLRWIRRLLQPVLKLFFNPNVLIQALHVQAKLNAKYSARLELDPLQFEVLHNLVLETTRLGIEVKNLKMRVESLTSRLEFNERRARALERVVAYKPDEEAPAVGTPPPRIQPAPVARETDSPGPGPSPAQAAQPAEGPGQRSRRRRRRRGRRGGLPAVALMSGPPGEGEAPDGATHPEEAGVDHVAGAEGQRDRADHRRSTGIVSPRPRSTVKLAVVVQRYGSAINGGAELHARYIAEHLARHAEVEVITTCATDYVTWRNELSPGIDSVNGVAVRRFRVSHERDPLAFGRLSERVFNHRHALSDELRWLASEGPRSPALIGYVAKHATEYDFWIFFSYRYYHAYHGARAVPSRAILVPTAERDSAVGLSLFKPIFRGVRALMYNSPEERAMIHAVSGNHDVPSVVVGVGSEIPDHTQAGRFRRKFNLDGPFAIYVGRIDHNKGCEELFDFFGGYLSAGEGTLTLVLVGHSLLPIPSHPRIRHLGFLDDSDKFDGMAAADVLIMPSYFESLSMVALEAWALGRPVLANAKCDVLKGQCIRSGAGLYYDGRHEFVETLRAVERSRWLSAALGRNGRQFFREHYDWPVIERKYLEMMTQLSKEAPARPLEPLPGWFSRRQSACSASAEIVAALPTGPSLGSTPEATPARDVDADAAARGHADTVGLADRSRRAYRPRQNGLGAPSARRGEA